MTSTSALHIDSHPTFPEWFQDGGTLVVALHVNIYLTFFTHLSEELRSREGIDDVLLDFAPVNAIQDPGIDAVAEVADTARQRRIRLLILDASREVHDKLAARLPDAVWIGGEGRRPRPH